MRRAALGLVALGMLTAAAGASAGVVPGWAQSIRWAGWIAARHGQHFDHVSASWRVPSAHCPDRGNGAYSLTWVGLGGADENKLEQIGTESDCPPGVPGERAPTYSLLWWEVLPAPEQYPPETVNPGDLVDASVTISRGRATVVLRDVSRGWRFTKRVRVKHRALTESSADWIEEDPEVCPGTLIHVDCPEKPFAHYRKVTFSNALAGTTGHIHGPILDSHWDAIRYGMLQGNTHLRLLSWPSQLNAAGNGFGVSRTNTLRVPPEPV